MCHAKKVYLVSSSLNDSSCLCFVVRSSVRLFNSFFLDSNLFSRGPSSELVLERTSHLSKSISRVLSHVTHLTTCCSSDDILEMISSLLASSSATSAPRLSLSRSRASFRFSAASILTSASARLASSFSSISFCHLFSNVML